MHAKSSYAHAVLRHTEFCPPHAETLLDETRVPRHQRYDARRSRTQNDCAFVSFLGAVQALLCPTGYLTVYVTHDTPTCFMCDKSPATMHQRPHRKGNGRLLRLGPAPPAHEAVVFDMTGAYLNVDTSAEFDQNLPMCSTCFAAEQSAPCDFFSPAVHEAECKAAESIMHRHWEKGGSWDCCTTIYPKKSADLPLNKSAAGG